MKAYKFVYISIFSLLLITCNKEDSDVEKSLETLSGTWKLLSYMGSDNVILLSEPLDISSPVMMCFKDNNDTGNIIGHTVKNSVRGEYKLMSGNKMTVPMFGGTKIGEPEWGSLFWDAIRSSKSYFVDTKQLKIYYADNKYMLFEKAPDYFINMYYDQTKCADPWHTTENSINNATMDSLELYLLSQNISVFDISFNDESILEKTCKSCGCGTGQRIIVTCLSIDSEKLKNIGFKILN
jgi:hypothetical protein